ncbi:MAG: AAA family ATPase [Candidatus Sumerlaeaceae bacterium]|nr:AAA family ATPase [Candidatus Sumerlaeaceae bacterium]
MSKTGLVGNTSPQVMISPSLEILVRARYPILYIVSWEEERVMGELTNVANVLSKKIYDWSIVQGIARYRPGVRAPIEGKKGTKDPILALREVLEVTEPAIFVFRDFHDFITDPNVKRTLRDLSSALRVSLSTVILLSPILRIPEELEKDLTIVDYPLPGREEIRGLLTQIAHDIAGNQTLKVDLSPDSIEAMVDAAIGLTLNEAENVFAKTLVVRQRLSKDEAPLIYSEKRQIIRKSGLLEYIDSTETLDSVGGLDMLKEGVMKRRRAMAPCAREFGLLPPRGLLLVGVQGCGKSLAAKAIANELGFPLLRMDVGRLFSKMVGETELNVRRALATAETVAPVVLWIDEIEKGLSGVKSSSASDAGTTSRLFGTIITWLQEKQAPVFVVATANEIEELPPEILRKGRFDEIFFVDLPAESERREIFRIHLLKRGRDPQRFDLTYLAQISEGYSGAEIEQAIIEALYQVYGVKEDIETADIVLALKQQVPLSRTMREAIQNRRLWAATRTVSASSERHLADVAVQPDLLDEEKESLYIEFHRFQRTLAPAIRGQLEPFLGSFPGKHEDLEKMRLYLADYKRLAAKLIKEYTIQ